MVAAVLFTLVSAILGTYVMRLLWRATADPYDSDDTDGFDEDRNPPTCEFCGAGLSEVIHLREVDGKIICKECLDHWYDWYDA